MFDKLLTEQRVDRTDLLRVLKCYLVGHAVHQTFAFPPYNGVCARCGLKGYINDQKLEREWR